MSFEENIVTIHIYKVLSLLEDSIGQLIDKKVDLYLDFDIEKFIDRKELKLAIKLINSFILFLQEEYEVENYKVQITKYNYLYSGPEQVHVLSCDNSPHHPKLLTFPHHKHYYPKNKYQPVSFSGELTDFLQEVKWLIESFKDKKDE